MPELFRFSGSCSLTVGGKAFFNIKSTSSDNIQKKKDITREELDDLNKPDVSKQDQNDPIVNVEENDIDFDTDTVDETDQKTNKTLDTGKIREEETQITPLTNGKINKTSKSMALDNEEFELLNAGIQELWRRTSASNLSKSIRSFNGSYSTYFGGNALGGISRQENHKQLGHYTPPFSYQYQIPDYSKLTSEAFPIIDVGKSVIGNPYANLILKQALKEIGELKADGTLKTTLQQLELLFESSHAVNASEEVNHQNGEVKREIKPLRPYAGNFLPTLSEHGNNSDTNLEKQAIVLLSLGKNKNADGIENGTETKKSRKLTFRLNVITPEHFREAMRDAQMNTYELTYSRLFPNNCRLFIELPINRNGIIGRAEKKAVKKTRNERKIHRLP